MFVLRMLAFQIVGKCEWLVDRYRETVGMYVALKKEQLLLQINGIILAMKYEADECRMEGVKAQ